MSRLQLLVGERLEMLPWLLSAVEPRSPRAFRRVLVLRVVFIDQPAAGQHRERLAIGPQSDQPPLLV